MTELWTRRKEPKTLPAQVPKRIGFLPSGGETTPHSPEFQQCFVRVEKNDFRKSQSRIDKRIPER
jgi:hypothetical protein